MNSLFDDYDVDDTNFPSFGRECKLCGKDGLAWEEFDGTWKLIDPKTCLVHRCKPVTVDDFMNSKL